MKQLLLCFLVTILGLFTYAQNGGQANENSVIKIDYVGYSNGNHVFKITNKQPCSVSSQYTIQPGNGGIIDITLQGNGTYYVNVSTASNITGQVKARTISFCPNVAPDRGWVEITSTTSSLPIKFKSFLGKRIDSKTIQLVFEAEEDNTIQYYKVLVSFDGKTYIEKTLIFPDGIEGSKKYTITVKL